jgi:hypothetical protein
MSDEKEKTLCALQEEGYIDSHREAFVKLPSRPALLPELRKKRCQRSQPL